VKYGRNNMSAKLLRWLIFGVLLALVPLVFSWFCRLIFSEDASLKTLLSQGELLLITAALCAAAIGELLGSDDKQKNWKIISGGASLMILIFSALIFSVISNQSLFSTSPDIDAVKVASLIVYFCAFVSSGACVYLSE
jgi:hypothetical protein